MSSSNASDVQDGGWVYLPAPEKDHRQQAARILYLESYGSGSHRRIGELLQRHSQLPVDLIILNREHWRWLALTAHRTFATAINSLDLPAPDVVVASGPMDVAALSANLRAIWPAARLAAYFHESQWSYPAENLDPRPYLVSHLEALEAADTVWFNSRYHQRVFYNAAITAPDQRVRRLARDVVAASWHKTTLLYPPVAVSHPKDHRPRKRLSIAWSARWEPEKRPDHFVQAMSKALSAGVDAEIHLLGIPAGIVSVQESLPSEIRKRVSDRSGFPSRPVYEQVLAESDLWVSTAEHEFFGVAAIEAALLGVTPILPRALAYPETLPSAPSYRTGDIDALSRIIARLAGRPFAGAVPWRADARRFLAEQAAVRFDRLVLELAAHAAQSGTPPDRLRL